MNTKPKPLHFIGSDFELNEYQKAISSVCSILLDYDDDKMIPVYGFGGVMMKEGFGDDEVSHFFLLVGIGKKLPGVVFKRFLISIVVDCRLLR